jgi:hypothetical protein
MPKRTAKSCGPDAAVLASSSWEAKLLRGDGGKKAVHRGELEVSRKPSRRESRDVWLHLYARVRFLFTHLHTRPRVPSRRPVFPAPSACLRAKQKRKARAQSRREDADAREACCLTVESYFRVIASPLRSALAISPTCRPDSSSTAPFWLVSTIARAPLPTVSPAPAAP